MRFLICALLLGVVAGYSSKSSYVPQQTLENINAAEPVEEPILHRIRNNSVGNDLPKTEAPLPSSTADSESSIQTSPVTSSLASTAYTTVSEPQFAASSESIKPETEVKPILVVKPIKEELEPPLMPAQMPEEESYSESSIAMPAEEFSKRRVITYDQRQEGQYNIRADLDNFMIVLIPPSPADGLNLLDLLTKSALRPTKSKRKQYASSSGHSHNNVKYRQNLKSGNTNFNLNYLPRAHSSAHQPPVTLVESIAVKRMPTEFIEGRTPYHVDISANDDEHSRLQPDRQVDVLPPPYPLAYQHLIKPFHLEAEPTVIQTLPPAQISQNVPPQTSSNFLETYNQLLATSLNAHSNSVNNEAAQRENNLNNPAYYRMSRNIRNDNYLDSNRLVSYSENEAQRRLQVPLYRAEMSYGASNKYPPIDVPRLMGYLDIEPKISRVSQEEHDDDGPKDLNEVVLVSSTEDALELDLSNSGLAGSDITGGLMERCAPGRRRDSYGICREIAGY